MMLEVMLRITRGPSLDAGVIVDLNSRAPIYLTGPPSLGSPTATVSNGVVEWSNRTLSLPLAIYGLDSAVMTAAIGSVARALSSGEPTWIMFRRSEHDAVSWFRIIAPVEGALDFKHVRPDREENAYLWDLGLVAESHAYGPEAVLWEGSLPNSTSGIVKDLPAPAGDVACDAIVTVTPSVAWHATAGACQLSMVSWDPVASPGEVTAMLQSETDSTSSLGSVVDDASALGGQYRYRTIGGTGLGVYTWTRSTRIAAGRYAVMARTRGVDSAPGPLHPGVLARLSTVTASGAVLQGRYSRTYYGGSTTAHWSWQRLGYISAPVGIPPSAVRSSVLLPGLKTSLQNDADALLLVPEQLGSGDGCSSLAVQFQGDAPDSVTSLRVDGIRRAVGFRSGAEWVHAAPPLVLGGFPRVSPRVSNRIVLLHSLSSATADDVSASATVRVAYHPRSLHMQSAS